MKATLTIAAALVFAASASAAVVDFTLTTDSISGGNQGFTRTTDIKQVVSGGIVWNNEPASSTFRAATLETDVNRIVDASAGDDFLDLGRRAKSDQVHANIVLWDLGSPQGITQLSVTTRGNGGRNQDGAWVIQNGTSGVDATYYVATFQEDWNGKDWGAGTVINDATALRALTWNSIALETNIGSSKGTVADVDSLLADATAVGVYYGSFGTQYNTQSELKISQFTAVPEPATMGLLSLGGLAFLKRRRS
jgi:hypothetical protein